MAKILNLNILRHRLMEKRITIFTPEDLMRLFGVSKSAATFFVFRNTRKGFLTRLKKSQKGSLYCLTEALPPPFVIANRLYEPSYLSLDTALSYYGIIPETIYSVTSVTTKPTREMTVNGIKYIYSRIKKSAYTGYRLVSYINTKILMASPEKALADYLYFVNLKERELTYERLDLSKIKYKKLVAMVDLFNRPGLYELIEKIYAESGRIGSNR